MNVDSRDDLYYEPVYTIGHAAKKLGVAVPTLRMYEQSGLIIPFKTETKRRLYSRHDIIYLELIIKMIRVHRLNIEAIKHLAALTPCWRILNCPKECHQNCRAFTENSLPCWILPHTSCNKSNKDCRTCDVYLSCPQLLDDPKSLLKCDY